MSLLSSIKNVAVKSFYKVADPVLTTIAHPIKVASAIVSKKKTVKQVQQQFFSQPKSSQITQTIISGVNTAILASGVGGIIKTGIGATIAGTSIKSATKKVGALAGLAVAESVIGSSPKIQKQIVEAPSNISNFGKGISEAIEQPTLENGLRIVKDHPFLSATALTALLVSMGYSLSLINNILNTRATNKNTKALEDASNQVPPSPVSSPQEIKITLTQPPVSIPTAVEALPTTTEAVAPAVGLTPTAKPKKKKKKKKTKKKKKKTKKKKKKKTRRSRKKTKKKKKKSIKRRKN